jgi:hypothetical protein
MLVPVAVPAAIAFTKAVAASAAITTTHTAIVAGAVAGAISGGSTATLVAYVGTPWGRKILKRVLKKLSIQELVKLAQAIAKTVNVMNTFCQATDTTIRDVGLLAQAIQQGFVMVM